MRCNKIHLSFKVWNEEACEVFREAVIDKPLVGVIQQSMMVCTSCVYVHVYALYCMVILNIVIVHMYTLDFKEK